MTATSQGPETTLGDTKFCFVGRSWGPRSRSDLERPLNFEAKSRLRALAQPPTHYGGQRKPGPRHSCYFLGPGLRRLPP
jgi:hypothetical protein